MARRGRGSRAVNYPEERVGSFSEFGMPILKCRSLRHSWEPEYTTVERIDRVKMYVLHLRCTRCETTRVDTIQAATGERDGRAYGYPEKYLIGDLAAWGGRTEFTNNIRRELVSRVRVRKEKK